MMSDNFIRLGTDIFIFIMCKNRVYIRSHTHKCVGEKERSNFTCFPWKGNCIYYWPRFETLMVIGSIFTGVLPFRRAQAHTIRRHTETWKSTVSYSEQILIWWSQAVIISFIVGSIVELHILWANELQQQRHQCNWEIVTMRETFDFFVVVVVVLALLWISEWFWQVIVPCSIFCVKLHGIDGCLLVAKCDA